ncbi:MULTISPECIES: hypothetical protein [unclassified Aerococcus]|uniref:hypothetical protein n=1 Tax=unclassified Aerococcus TaxID=2618060 RepID=UPI0008A35FBD|nr:MULTISPECIES: hypothetical protein [unclassified Aerococcus]MDK6679201.1 hypothetical protein [Aerococcus sp. UMB8608]MDK6685957.1 hypothetical protein [Aerococcus sp. UMB8623]MDK6940762.1 hypothetical protein [Aerococcus sp. UMB8487]OFK21265.1 hypothetical protein HMPREF2829_03740 [Aerococcus sp. HMSC072A12]OFR32578.1 hypothetical protein HMPREF2892_08170 [Aerococcus sp. HMSC061A03]
MSKKIERIQNKLAKQEEHIVKLKADLKEAQDEKKALSYELEHEQGQVLMKKFWDSGIKNFEEIDDLLSSLIDENDIDNKQSENLEEEIRNEG